MFKLLSASKNIFIPVTGPDGVDLTQFPVGIALILESVGGEPATGDYKTATWTDDGEATMLISAGDYAAGQYLVFVRIQAAPEDIREFSGRARIGDART